MRRTLIVLLASYALVLGCGPNGGSGSSAQGGSAGDAGSAGTGASGGTMTTGGAAGTGGAMTTGGSAGSGAAGSGGAATCGPDVDPPNEFLPDVIDPEGGDFTLDEALVELPAGPGPLRAIIDTDLGALTCTFHEKEAPIGVANFIGLARGRRAWRDPTTKKFVRRPFYDGLTFHRVIPDFVAQGGDPLGNGMGGPGYTFVNEIAGLTHKAGTLAYANAGPDTNGSQFYICEKPQPSLDADYTIFGECEPVSVVTAMTHVPVDGNDKPLTPIHIKKVTITRCAP